MPDSTRRPPSHRRLHPPRVTAWVCAAIGVMLAAPALTLADGDPASDVLASQAVYVPSDGGFSASQTARLSGLLAEARRSGVPIRVALIATQADLGSVGELWRQPQDYARFLGQELAQVYRGTLVVAMPAGFGVVSVGGAPGGGQVGVAAPHGPLVTSTMGVVQAVAATDGHRLALPARLPHRDRARRWGQSTSAPGWPWPRARPSSPWPGPRACAPARFAPAARHPPARDERVGSRAMDPERARDLLARERGRIEQALGLHTRGSLESDEDVEPGEEDSEDLYQDETGRGPARRPAGGFGRGRTCRGAARGRDLRAVGAQRGTDPRRTARGSPDGRADRRGAAAPVIPAGPRMGLSTATGQQV